MLQQCKKVKQLADRNDKFGDLTLYGGEAAGIINCIFLHFLSNKFTFQNIQQTGQNLLEQCHFRECYNGVQKLTGIN